MSEHELTLDTVVSLALRLPTVDRVRLIERIAANLEHDLEPQTKPNRPSPYGMLAHLGKMPSFEEIAEARREMWANFPREDIA